MTVTVLPRLSFSTMVSMLFRYGMWPPLVSGLELLCRVLDRPLLLDTVLLTLGLPYFGLWVKSSLDLDLCRRSGVLVPTLEPMGLGVVLCLERGGDQQTIVIVM